MQLAGGGVGEGFLLHGGVDNDAAEVFAGNQFQGDYYFNGEGQESFNAYFAQQFAKLDQLGWVAGPTVFKVFVAKKYCQVGVSPQRWMSSSSFSLKVCLRYKMATIRRGGQGRTSGFGDASTDNHFGRAK